LDLENLRREYLSNSLQRENLLADPIKQFELWLEQAIKLEIPDPTAMVAGTVSKSGQPSQRIVLLKHLDQQGFVFFTNYGSRKAKEIAGNSKVSLLFPWHGINRQVKVAGEAQKISSVESLKYFMTRPRDSQLAAWASEQSQVLSSRQLLMTQLENMKQKFSKGEIPLPDFWGGILVKPQQIEFWQGGENRLHDRFEYNLQADDSWVIQRLAP
jgi:pyridoxamine 5'-phosphate oxidase